MRTALLSAVRQLGSNEGTNNDAGELAAFLPFLGQTVLSAQFEMACHLGAERIVCLAQSGAPEIIAVQHEAERRGVDFHLITSHLALARLVSADHELITIQDGVLIDRTAISGELLHERGLLCVPADAGTARGFERIDAQWAWAGLSIIRGDLAAKLAELPADSDPASLLLRLALQARVPIVALGEDHLIAGTVSQPKSAQDLANRQKYLLSNALDKGNWAGPGTKLARIAAMAMMPAALKSGAVFASIASGVLGFAAVCLAAFSLPILSGILLLFAAIAVAISNSFFYIKGGLKDSPSEIKEKRNINYLYDGMAIVSIALILGVNGPDLTMIFAPICIGAIRIAAIAARRRSLKAWEALWDDRIVLLLILITSLALGYLPAAIASLSLAALAFALFQSEKPELRQA